MLLTSVYYSPSLCCTVTARYIEWLQINETATHTNRFCAIKNLPWTLPTRRKTKTTWIKGRSNTVGTSQATLKRLRKGTLFIWMTHTCIISRTITYSTNWRLWYPTAIKYTGLFISPSGISELDCATTKTDTAERSISIGSESLQVSVLPYRCSTCAPLVTRQMSILRHALPTRVAVTWLQDWHLPRHQWCTYRAPVR